MLFVDGENFTKAGQRALASDGLAPEPGSRWRRDVFLWTPQGGVAWWPFMWHSQSGPSTDPPRRAYYYTSDTADEPEWTATRLQLRDIGFEPRLFKRRRGRTKAVDVALAADVLTLGAGQQYEVALLVAGDGDYVPVVESVKRLGLHVVVAFLAADTNPELRIAADAFQDVTEDLCRDWRHFERTRRDAEPSPGDQDGIDPQGGSKRNDDP